MSKNLTSPIARPTIKKALERLLLSLFFALPLIAYAGHLKWMTERSNVPKAPPESPLERELMRRMDYPSRWVSHEGAYVYGDLTIHHWIDRFGDYYELEIKGRKLWAILDSATEKRINARAKELCRSLERADHERREQKKRREADKLAEELKRTP